jgi:hypothetical protein
VTGLQRHKPMKRSTLHARTALTRGKPLARKGRVKPRNAKRKAEQFARNFGDEADAVRAMPCLCRGRGPVVRCAGPVAAAHVKSRGASGGRFDLVPMCKAHHDEQHAVGVETFAASYGLDLRAEADRIALEHVEPLGIRGLALRWSAVQSGRPLFKLADGTWQPFEAVDRAGGCEGCIKPDALDTYELDALLGWVRRRMDRVPGQFRAATTNGFDIVPVLFPPDHDALAHAIMLDLGQPFTSDPSGEHGLAWSLCEAVGWPS